MSIDPALHGLVSQPIVKGSRSSSSSSSSPAARVDYSDLPKELRHEKLEGQEQSARAKSARVRMCDDLAGVERLSILAQKVQAASVRFHALAGSVQGDAATSAAAATSAGPTEVDVGLPSAGRVVVVLPHAHVTPDEALACLRFAPGLAAASLSIVQLPCCGFVYHAAALGQPADAHFLDARIATSARAVRVWRDVATHFDFTASAPLGLRWRRFDCGPERPRKGTEIVNAALSAALQIKVEFTQAELEGVALCGLQSGAFVRAGGAWFEPHTPRWRGVGSARSPHAALRKAAQ